MATSSLKIAPKNVKASDNFALAEEKLSLADDVSDSKNSNSHENRAPVCDVMKTLLLASFGPCLMHDYTKTS